MTSRWPNDDPKSLAKFYGDPATGEPGRHLVPVVPPFKMYYGGKAIRAIQFHKKAAPALQAALDEIWEHYGRDQATIDRLRISSYSGAYNPRLIRGSRTKWSNHAYGAAIDFDAEHNGFGAGKGTMPQPVIDAFKRQGALWGGDYRGRTDPMHFEFCSRGEAPVGFGDFDQIDGHDHDLDEDGREVVEDVPAADRPNAFLRFIKSKTQWATTALGGISITSLLGFLADYRVILALGAVGLMGFIVYKLLQRP